MQNEGAEPLKTWAGSELTHDGRIYYFQGVALPKWTINLDYVANAFGHAMPEEEWYWWKGFTSAFEHMRSDDAAVTRQFASRALQLLSGADQAELDLRLAFLSPAERRELVPDWLEALRLIVAGSEIPGQVHWIAGGPAELELLLAAMRRS